MKSARLHAIKDFRVDEVKIPIPTGEQLLLKVGACGICGSDIPRIFELGTSKQKYPLALGHEFGGTIVAVGEKADQSLIGKRGAIFPCIPCRKCSSCVSGDYAMCLDYDYLGSRSDGGFAEYCLIPSAWHFVEASNPETSSEALAMVEPCTVAQHAVRRSNLKAGYSVIIFGAGPIGIMTARWAKIFGADPVVLVDVVDEKVEFARGRGQIVLNGITQDIVSEFKKLNGGRLADIVIEGTGTSAALNQAIDCVKTFGTIAMLGNPHKDTTIKLLQHSSILRKEINLAGVWNSHYSDTPLNEWKYTVRMMDCGKMIVNDLITHRCKLEGLPQLCEDIYMHKVNICKALYSEDVK
jgi:L-iditol 2-dehydrogenase